VFLSRLICLALTLYQLALFGRIILSWFPMQPGTALASVHSVLWRITEPVLGPLRRTIPALQLGGLALDLSPILVLIAIQILQGILC